MIVLQPAIRIAVVGRGFLVEWTVDGKPQHAHAHNRDVLAKVVHEVAKQVRGEQGGPDWPDVGDAPAAPESAG